MGSGSRSGRCLPLSEMSVADISTALASNRISARDISSALATNRSLGASWALRTSRSSPSRGQGASWAVDASEI